MYTYYTMNVQACQLARMHNFPAAFLYKVPHKKARPVRCRTGRES
jgi:hypothetical protein